VSGGRALWVAQAPARASPELPVHGVGLGRGSCSAPTDLTVTGPDLTDVRRGPESQCRVGRS
jgi:hypothetical protein